MSRSEQAAKELLQKRSNVQLNSVKENNRLRLVWTFRKRLSHFDRRPNGKQNVVCRWTVRTINKRKRFPHHQELLPETKSQSSWWHTTTSPRPKKSSLVVKSQLKAMLIAFFEGLMHLQFVPDGQTVNSGFYNEVLKRLWASSKKPDKMGKWTSVSHIVRSSAVFGR